MASSGVAIMRWACMATEAIAYLTAHSSEAATQRRNAGARYRLQMLDRRDAMANASAPIASSGGIINDSSVAAVSGAKLREG